MATHLIGADAGISDDDNITKDFISMCKFVASETGYVSEVRVKVGDSTNVKAGIYADNAGEPAALLSSNQTGQACTTGWNTISIPSTYIKEDTNYWLAINSDDSYVRTDSSGTNILRYKSLAYANAWPDPAGTSYTAGTAESALAGWGQLAGIYLDLTSKFW